MAETAPSTVEPPIELSDVGRTLVRVAVGQCLPARLALGPVVDEAAKRWIVESGLTLDYRAQPAVDGCAPTECGLAFDPDAVRSQTFALSADDRAVAVMTILVEPRRTITQQRFFCRSEAGYVVSDSRAALGAAIPAFAIVPGWTEVVPEVRGRFGRWGLPLMTGLVATAGRYAPAETWFMTAATGPLPYERRAELEPLWRRPIGTSIAAEEFPVPEHMMGVTRRLSRSTETFARMVGWPKISGVVTTLSLGPLFAHPVASVARSSVPVLH